VTDSARSVFASRTRDGGWRLAIWVQPGAKRTEYAGLHGEYLKIRLAAPAVDNKANSALTEFLARTLGVRIQSVIIVSGHASRQKNVNVDIKEELDWNQFSVRPEGKPQR